MNEIKLPPRPEPDGFITIRIIGRDVEVNAYRDSTMGDYATQAVEADRAARGESVAWLDEFGNAFPLAANKSPTWMDSYKRNWKPLYTSPQPAQQECYHDDTERLGAIWTRCNQCGKKWADDEAQPAQQGDAVAWADEIIDDLHALYDSEMITENDSGDELIRLDAAVAAVDEAKARHIAAHGIKETP